MSVCSQRRELNEIINHAIIAICWHFEAGAMVLRIEPSSTGLLNYGSEPHRETTRLAACGPLWTDNDDSLTLSGVDLQIYGYGRYR